VTILGIDPGTAACGYGVVTVRGGKLEAIEFGCWSTSPADRLEQRLCRLHEEVSRLIETHAPDAAALEESYVGADRRTALSVGQARGAVLVACAAAGLPCTEYPPATVKQAVCGYGRAEKEQVKRMVGAILHLPREPTPSHAADALAVAICHALAPPLQLLATGARR
jgi:crossover junction endodeoxyribonuclease RuvC